MTSLLYSALGWVLPIVLGPLVYVVARYALNAGLWVDDLPPAFKRVAVVAIGGVIAAAFNALGIAPPPECVDMQTQAALASCAGALNAPVVVRGVTASLVAMLIHALKKSRPNI